MDIFWNCTCHFMLSQSVSSQSMSESVSQWLSRSVILSVNLSASKSVSQSVILSASKSVRQSCPVSESVRQSFSQ